MKLIRDFKKLNKNDTALAGGKGASLGEMTQAGILVPAGFVILSNAFEQFLEETDLNVEIDSILHSVNHKEMHTVENASEKIQALILNANIPEDIESEIKKFFKDLNTKYVAVRSSATAEDSASAAWAGQLDSFLNTSEDTLLENVKKCWASLFTPRAIFYRFEKELHKQKISVAVVIQKMVESESSGVAFSVHPVTQDRNQLIIEAGFGLGEAIVSGQITPDSYVIEKQPRRIIDKNIAIQAKGIYRGGWKEISQEQGEKQALSDKQILELSQLILKIEKHYGFPCDIEWAFEKGKFYIVQSRPITTLSLKVESKNQNIQIENYQRLFQFNGFVPFALSYQFVNGYYHLGGLTFSHSKEWLSYMLKTAIQNTLQEGLELYSNKNAYENYKKEVYATFKDVQDFEKKYKKLKKINKEEFSKFLQLFKKYEQLYIKTEFFYTDLAFEKKKELPVIEDNFKSFESFKLDGRKYLNDLFFAPESIFGSFLKKTAKQLDASKDEIWSYSFEEMENLFNGKKVSKEVISERQKAYVIYATQQGIHSFVGKEAEDFIKNNFSQSNATIIKGKVANKGKITATAKVIKVGLSDYGKLSKVIDEMEQGQVLVAETTEPSIITACKKASAIVTNQGGMMSHAAIISREMNIPCIVGTSIATDVIKDGDLVEVDANNGVIKILEQGKVENKEDVLTVGGITWFMTVTRNMSFWHQWLSNEGHYSNTKNFGVDTSLDILAITVNETETHAFMHQPNYSEYTKAVLNAINTKAKVKKLKERYEVLAVKLLKSLEKCNKDLTVKNWETFVKDYTQMCAGLFLTANIGRSGGDLLIQKLKEKGYSDLEVPQMVATITYPAEHTPLFKSQIDLLEIGVKVQNGKVSQQQKTALLQGWLKKYRNIPVNLSDEPWTEKDAENQLDSILRKNCKKEIELLNKDHKERIKKSTATIKKIRDKEIEILAYAIAEATYMNEFRKNVFSKTSLEYRPIFQKIAQMAGSERWRDCFYLTADEMGDILRGKKVPLDKIITERKVVGIYRAKGAENLFINKKKLDDLIGYVKSLHGVKTDLKGDEIIKGHSANHGKVKGIVKIILNSKDFHKLNPGEILVTTMTSVDFVPVMERAAAFVTNEGGITSHASIVAREMNKPCIIGTKNATQILKDGDMVEVDAERGIVRVLNEDARGLEGN